MQNTICGVGGSLTALATPFRDTRVDWTLSRDVGAPDRARHRRVDRLRQHRRGRRADPSEYARAVHTVVEAAAGRVPVIAGCTAMSTPRRSRWASRRPPPAPTRCSARCRPM